MTGALLCRWRSVDLTTLPQSSTRPYARIGEVARLASLRPSAIRYYERIGLVPVPVRSGRQRRYDRQVLERLAIIRFAKHVGFKGAEIEQLLDGIDGRPPPKRWRTLAKQKRADVDEIIARAIGIRKMLDNTLRQKCPKLVERGPIFRSARMAQLRN